MQLVDSELYIANIRRGAERQRDIVGATHVRSGGGLISRLRGTSASERLLALLLAAFVLTESPALLATVRSTVSLALQILLQAGHFGIIAFQIFGR